MRMKRILWDTGTMLATVSSRTLVCVSTLLLPFLVATATAAPKDQWRPRAIYQVMVDRFARTDNSTTSPCNVTDRAYCGGTWCGLLYHLDYIQGMGLDAIWIGPISAGIQGMKKTGSDYTGYWVTDMMSLNENFGTEEDLLALSKEIHNRGMLPSEAS